MAVIRDMMPAFQLFQPTTTDEALGCSTSTRSRPGYWRAG